MDIISELIVACGEDSEEWEGDTEDLCFLAVQAIKDQAALEREAIKKIVIAEKGMHEFTKSDTGVAVCNSILATIDAERE